jgi:hypothetical protein
VIGGTTLTINNAVPGPQASLTLNSSSTVLALSSGMLQGTISGPGTLNLGSVTIGSAGTPGLTLNGGIQVSSSSPVLANSPGNRGSGGLFLQNCTLLSTLQLSGDLVSGPPAGCTVNMKLPLTIPDMTGSQRASETHSLMHFDSGSFCSRPLCRRCGYFSALWYW